MTRATESIDARVGRLHRGGVIDMHFDLPMDLYEKRDRQNVLATEFLPEFETGGMAIIGAAIYIEDKYLPERGTLRSWLLDGVNAKRDSDAGIFLGTGESAPLIGFLFPGQGSPAGRAGSNRET